MAECGGGFIAGRHHMTVANRVFRGGLCSSARRRGEHCVRGGAVSRGAANGGAAAGEGGWR